MEMHMAMTISCHPLQFCVVGFSFLEGWGDGKIRMLQMKHSIPSLLIT